MFMIHDPKEREIHALHYVDRVVQHCICDEVLAPVLDKKLIYDNAASRINKGTHFAIGRVCDFLHSFYNKHKTNGYFLRFDFKKFFDSIDHETLKKKLMEVFDDTDFLELLFHIIDSYEVSPGKGLPMGNQTSQWFAIYYLDAFDRLIKEKLQIKFYSRYMDDGVIVHNDKNYLKHCMNILEDYARDELKLSFNSKTQIAPVRNGVDYLGWHIYLSETGKIIRKVKQQTKYRYKRKLCEMQKKYRRGEMELEEIKQILSSFHAHLAYGHTYKLKKKVLKDFVLKKDKV